MRDPIEALLGAIQRDAGGIALVWSPQDVGVRDWLVSQVLGLTQDRAPAVVETVDQALAFPDRLAVIVPRNEAEAVADLDASRERIRSVEAPRTQPIVLFLYRDGAGQRALADAASLRSLTGGSDPDPEALSEAPVAVDQAGERTRFEARMSRTPEVWLAEWRHGSLAQNAENYAVAAWADFLVRG